jgi:hypothetical protein
MNRCLDDRALVLAAIDERSAETRVHLGSCRSCSSRYAQLTGDLDVIGAALRGAPPRLTPAPSSHHTERFWVAAALAMAAAVTLIVALQWLRRPAGTEFARVSGASSATTRARDVSAYAEEVSEAMFDPADQRLSSGIFDVATRDNGQRLTPEAATLQEALEAGPVCTGGRFIDGDCNDYVSALFF